MHDPLLDRRREFLKDTIRLETDFSQTDQSQGVDPPPIEKPFGTDAVRVKLPRPDQWQQIEPVELLAAIQDRRSHRRFTRDSLTLEQLAFLLWTTQGIQQRLDRGTALRTVPSAGARHPGR